MSYLNIISRIFKAIILNPQFLNEIMPAELSKKQSNVTQLANTKCAMHTKKAFSSYIQPDFSLPNSKYSVTVTCLHDDE